MCKLALSIVVCILCYNGGLVRSAEEPSDGPQGSAPNEYPKEKPTDVVVEIVRAVGDCTKAAKVGDLLSVHYNGTFTNGSTSDSDSR